MPAPAATWTRCRPLKFSAWEKAYLTFMRDQKPEIRKAIEESKDLTEDTTKAIEAAIAEFKHQYTAKPAATARV